MEHEFQQTEPKFTLTKEEKCFFELFKSVNDNIKDIQTHDDEFKFIQIDTLGVCYFVSGGWIRDKVRSF